MQTILFADLSTRRLSKTLGGAAVVLPALVQGDQIRIGMRFSETSDAGPVEVQKTVTGVRASIGFVDVRPTAGKFILRTGAGPYVEGTNQTVPLAHNAAASVIQAALEDIGLTNAAVIEQDGSWIISNAGASITLSAIFAPGLANELRPASFARIRSTVSGGQNHYELRLIQTPLASVSTFDLVVPPAPSITRIQSGGTEATVVWPEIQALKILPGFRGSYIIKRGFRRTVELSVDDGPDEIAAALAPLADEDGSFEVSNPTTNVAHITFLGSMAGIEQPLLQVQVFSAPPGDPTIILDLDTAEVAAALRAADEIKPSLEIEVTVEDENDEETTYVLTPFRAPVTLIREINWSGLEAAANIDWLRPPHGRTYIPFTEDQIITGSQNYVAPVGDADNSEFSISHNLGTRDVHVTVRRNAPPFDLIHQTGEFEAGETGLKSTGSFFFYSGYVEDGDAIQISWPNATEDFDMVTLTFKDTPIASDDVAIGDNTASTLVANLLAKYNAIVENTEWTPDLSADGESLGVEAPYVGTAGDMIEISGTFANYAACIVSGATLTGGYDGIPSTQSAQITLDGPNDLTITFAGPPEIDEFVVTISTAGPESVFQAHTHTVAQIEGLATILDDLGSRIETLEGIVALPGATGNNTVGQDITITLPEIALLVPAVASASARPPLLGAVHDGTVSSVAPPLTDPAAASGTVQQINAEWKIPASVNRREWPVAANGYVASNGEVFYEVRKDGNSYFPVEYEQDIFMLWISAAMFPVKRALSLDVKPILQLLGNTRAQYMLEVSFGTLAGDTGTGYATNLSDINWASPIIEERLLLSSAIVPQPISLAVASDFEGTLTATASIYGRTQTVTAPASNAFAIRARLLNFDTENRSNPRGIVLVKMEEASAIISPK